MIFGTGSVGGGSSFIGRRRPSWGRRASRGNSLVVPLNEVVDDAGALDSARSSLVQQAVEDIDSDSDSSSDSDDQKMQRDDLVNPFWIEDRDLKNGPIDFLPGVEVRILSSVYHCLVFAVLT